MSNPFEDAGRQRKATLLIEAMHDLGIHSGVAPGVDEDGKWKQIAFLAEVKEPSRKTRELVLRLMPIGECPAHDEDRIVHRFSDDSLGCVYCGVDPFAVFEAEKEALSGGEGAR
jgi:hypothetical protein